MSKELAQPKKRKSPSPRQKTVSFKSLEKQVKKLNTYSVHIVNKETNEVIKYYEEFSEKKIDELLQELYDHIKYDEQRKDGEKYFVDNNTLLMYINFLIAKHFSHFKDEIGSQFETNIQGFNFMYEKGYYHLLHQELFNPEQVMKVFDRYYEREELASKIIELDEETKQKLANIQNKDILFKRNKIIPEV